MVEDRTGKAEESKQAARGILRTTFAVYLCFAGIIVLLMVAGLLSNAEDSRIGDAQKAGKHAYLLKTLLILFFFAATITNMGIQWAAKILAGRVYKRADMYHAAFVVAASQWVAFGIYALFAAMALYYRLAAGGPRKVFAIAMAAAALASFYFLRIPKYLLVGLYAVEETGEDPGTPASQR